MNEVDWVRAVEARLPPLALAFWLSNEVVIRVRCEDDLRHPTRCRVCRKEVSRFGRLPSRSIRDVDFDVKMVFLEVSFPRVECHEHGVVMAHQTFFEPHSSFTIAFEDYALSLVSDNLTQTEVAKKLKVTRNVLGRILDRAYRRRRKDREPLEGES